MVLHYIVHMTSSLLDISHLSCNGDYQPHTPVTSLGQFPTDLGFCFVYHFSLPFLALIKFSLRM